MLAEISSRHNRDGSDSHTSNYKLKQKELENHSTYKTTTQTSLANYAKRAQTIYLKYRVWYFYTLV